jgi:ABC-2 type transport system permease protein
MFNSFKRAFLPAAWLGWQIESNWTDPLSFIAFSIIKPVASVLILVFMYRAVSSTGTEAPIYAYIFLGNAFYIYVGAVLAGSSFSVLDDRERYKSLKYIYIAPIAIPIYMLGRAVARFLTGSLAVVITLVAGIALFNVPFDPWTINWPLFAASMVLGILSLAGLGIALGAWTLTIRAEPWFVGEGLAASLYLFSGAIFPLSVLPGWLQPVGYALPITYWLELVRRAWLGPGAAAFPTLAAWSDGQLLALLAAMTALCWLIALGGHRFFDRLARERGMIDVQSNY